MTPTDTPQEKPEHESANDHAHAPHGRVWVPALKEAAGAFFAAALVLVMVYSMWFFDFHPEFVRFADRGDVASTTISGDQFTPVQAGNGGYKDGAAVITEYLDGAAILEIKTSF